MPTVSIIIPIWGTAYNEFLPACLDSIKAQTYKDYEIIIVDTETDLSTARNVGIRKAKGEYILCLDADDMIDTTFLEKTIGKDDIVSVGQQMFGDEKEIWMPKEHPTHIDFLSGNQIHCCSLFKKEVWETVEGFDEDMKDGYEDWFFFLNATKAGYTITTIQEPLFFYRRHGETLVDKANKKYKEIYEYMMKKI
jgi:glycosyltransferase involved in cell wall biosynthesis